MIVGREWAALFIDGGYFAAILRDYFGEPRIDFLKLSEILCTGFERFRTYYYDCMPYQSNPPTEEEKKRYTDKNRFITYLKRLPKFEVRLGKVRKGKYGFEQKGIDVWLSVDLTRLAWSGTIRKAIIIGGDSDFVPAVMSAKEAHVLTEIVYHPKHVSLDLRDICDERREITSDLIKKVEVD